MLSESKREQTLGHLTLDQQLNDLEGSQPNTRKLGLSDAGSSGWLPYGPTRLVRICGAWDLPAGPQHGLLFPNADDGPI